MLEHLSTRGRIFWLVIASALPVILLSVYVALEQRGAAEARARDEMQHHAELVAALLRSARVDELPPPDTTGFGPAEVVAILDESATVVASYPPGSGVAGEGLRDRSVLDMIAKANGTVVEQRDAAGVLRLYASKRALMNRDRAVPITVLVSVPKAVIHDDINRALMQTLIGIAAVTLMLIVSAWYGAERLVLRPIRALLEMTVKVRAGDLSARTGMKRSREELSQLGSALDEMADQLQLRDAKLRDAMVELREQAITDSLTGLYNRRYFWDALTRQVLTAGRKGTTFSVILLDLDYFKAINDTWGHDAGDVVLKAVADVVRRSVRGSDIAVRYGGEEFAVLLPDTVAQIAEERAQNLRQSLEGAPIVYGTHAIHLTASFGVSDCDGTADASSLMKSVDEAMYAAKQSGRNTVVVTKKDSALRGTQPIHAGEFGKPE